MDLKNVLRGLTVIHSGVVGADPILTVGLRFMFQKTSRIHLTIAD